MPTMVETSATPDAVTCAVAAAAEAHGPATAIVTANRTIPYTELHRAVCAVSAELARHGVQQGTVVAMVLPRGFTAIVTLFACWRLGAIVFPLNGRFPEPYLADAAQRGGASLVVAREDGPELGLPAITAESLISAPGSSVASAHPQLDPTADATRMLTSGSSGAPKIAVHSIGNLYHSAWQANRNMPLAPGDKWLLSLPLYHVAGLGVLYRCFVAGAAVALRKSSEERPSAAMLRTGATHVSVVSTQLYRLLGKDVGRRALAQAKGILVGGGPVREGLIRRAHQYGFPVVTSYGLTETTAQITATRLGDPIERLLSSGQPLGPNAVRIGEGNEIEVRGDTLYKGYLREGALQRPSRDGWFPTGDFGRFDEHGYLHVQGRMDNMFIVGGENVQPEEIEQALCSIDGVLQAIVVPVPDAEYEHRPAAIVRLASDAGFDTGALSGQAQDRLPFFKQPLHYLPWPTHLDDTSVKPKRGPMRAWAMDALGLADES